MKIFKTLVATLASALLVSACGGGGSGTLTSPPPGGGGTGTTTTTSLVVTAAPASIASDGSNTATIVATARDANNALVSGAKITFAASAGGGIAPGTATTDATGTATAKLSNVGAAAGTSIKVTATTAGASGSVNVNVVAIQQTLTLVTDTPNIHSDGSIPATITALLLDANNNALPGVVVSFKASSGGIAVTQGTTDATGIAKATLSTAGDPTNRIITVTASAGTATPVSIGVPVTGTSLSVTGPASLVLGGVGVYPVTLTDSGGKGISNRTVTVSSANGNTVSTVNGVPFVTDTNGQVTVQLTATKGGSDTLTATALGITKTTTVAVSAESFTMTPVPPTGKTDTPVNLGAIQTVTATWLNNNVPQAGKTVNFTASRGTLSALSAMTDANGVATVTISSATAGSAIVAASATDPTSGTGVAAQTMLDFIATTPTQISLQASPASVATQGSSTLTATVRDAANNLVEGTVVDFLLTDSTGGTLSPASAPTDAQGRAQTVYTAGSTTSAANGVTVTAKLESAPAVTPSKATITVGGQTYFLSLGTGNTIAALDAATYQMTFVVLAVDAQGAAVSGVNVTMQVLPEYYFKGQRVWNGSFWGVVVSTTPGEASCANEDTDYTGSLTSLLPVIKDYNGNGKLDPGNVATVSPPSVVTGSDGRVLVYVTYPKDHADYVGVNLIASTKVNGTQSSTTSTFVLPSLAADVNQLSVGPPGPVSPYGTAIHCILPN